MFRAPAEERPRKMKLRTLKAMGVLATTTLLACSSAPPPPVGGTAGSNAGQAGAVGSAGTSGSAGSTGSAGAGQAGAGQAGAGQAGAGQAGAGQAGAGQAGAGQAGTGGAGTAGAGQAGTGGAGTAGAGGGGAGGMAMATTCPTGVQGHCNSDTVAAMGAHAGYTLALAEEFDAPIDLDNDPVWTWSDGSPADGQTRFRKEQISFAGGKMMIKAESPCAASLNNPNCIAKGSVTVASPEGALSYAEPTKPQTTGTIGAMGVWSGEFRTKYNNYRYGYYEARFKAPTANAKALAGTAADNNIAGDYLSTLFVFRSPKWQEWNEIDIELEPNHNYELAGNCVNALGATGYPAGNAAAFVTTTGLPTGFKIRDTHTYAFEWTPTKVVYYVDGVMSRTFTGAANVPIPPKSAKIMMNLWVFSGGAFGDGSSNTFPFQSEYEYFRFYKANTGEPTYPCSPTPSCLPADDKDSAQNNGLEKNYGQ
jgi:Glycosyl hydrolases family 16